MVKIKSVLGILTVVIALLGYFPLQAYIDPSARWFFPAALAVGLILQRKGKVLPPRAVTAVSVLLFVYFAARFSLQNLIQVTADLLVVFLGIRMLGERSGRNYLQVFALSLFCLAASSLYNLSALFLGYLLLLLVLLALSLVVLTFHSHDPEIALERREAGKALSVSLLMPVVSIPMLLFLFVILPRTQFPLWNFMNPSAATVTGFSESVKPGSAPSVTSVKGIVLRAVCREVPEQQLYWRGIVFNGFKGDEWVRLPLPAERAIRVGEGLPVSQEIYPEPSRNPYLLALNIPASLSGVRNEAAGDQVFVSRAPMERRLKYQAVSFPSGALRVAGGIDREEYLALPATVSARVRSKGAEISRAGSSAQKLKLVEDFFRAQRLTYATTDLPVGTDAIDSFLFVKKRGHCELFASACATLLRLAGVPARLVGGYRGGTYNAMGGYYVVTEDMAHVWVEAYQEGRGWVSVDPSAWSAGFASGRSAGRELRMYVDALGFYWNKAVITYDLEKQISLVRTAGVRARDLRLPAGVLPVAGWCTAAAGAAALLLTWYLRGGVGREERILRSFLRVLARRYPDASGGRRGLFELAESVGDDRVREFAALYGGAVYGDRELTAGELSRLREIIREIRQEAT
ncbi:membrane protein [Geomonas sp. Red276]